MAKTRAEREEERLDKVQADFDKEADEARKDGEYLSTGVAASHSYEFTAQAHAEGRRNAVAGLEPDEEPSVEREMAAEEKLQERPDIESRQSILAREMAYPSQFSDANVRSGSVDDGRVGVGHKPGSTKATEKSDEAEKEAATVKDNTARK